MQNLFLNPIQFGLFRGKGEGGKYGPLLAFKKEIGSIDPFVQFLWPSRFFLQNHENRKFLSLTREFILSCNAHFQEALKLASLGLETNFFLFSNGPFAKWAIHLKWIQSFRTLHFRGALVGNLYKILPQKLLQRPPNGPNEI